MIKSLFSPVQQWLLKHGQCVGCGMPLKKGSYSEKSVGTVVQCNCGRMYIEQKDHTYRRAKMSEAKA